MKTNFAFNTLIAEITESALEFSFFSNYFISYSCVKGLIYLRNINYISSKLRFPIKIVRQFLQ